MAEAKPRILVVEDDASMQDFLTTFLEQEGHEVRWAAHGGIARQLLQTEPFDVVITDIVMPEVDGLTVLDEVKEQHPDTAVIVMTGRSSVRQAVDLIRRGADDYFKKPFDIDEMLHVIRRSVDHRKALRESRTAAPAPPGEAAAPPVEAFPRIIGHSKTLLPIFELILKVADTNSTVLIQGASGTGKELVAAAIHEKSSRRCGPFIPVHCGAIPETLLESELFGHEKGSFTGAIARKEGVFRLADGGTLFLDEVSEMSVPLQVKLLRVLETGTFRRVGGVEDTHVDVRVLAATNRELREMVDKSLFRQDLYYRLNVFPIVLPPLCGRTGDIPLLAQHFLAKLARSGRPSCTASDEALALLCAHEWPGNVRELENVIERAVILCGGGEVRPEHLPAELRPRKQEAPPAADASGLPYRAAKAIFEEQYIKALLARHAGSVATAARAAGMSRAHFYELLRKHSIDLARYTDA
ncbi:MAG TPA: sigma-54 dependent transcriptional regulator [Planctomycetota bacterium]|nr:sigma-54 dependent transcriptional regulator [Planctomycetota bacterium]